MESEISELSSYSEVRLNDLPTIVGDIYEIGKSFNIWLFKADMGGGKTTFVSQLGKYLEVSDHVSSPTFGLVNEYSSPRIGDIYHFDFYRIRNESEAYEIGVEEYFDSGALCLIEWPERIPDLIPERFLLIEISHSMNQVNKRDFKVSKYG